MPPDPPAAPARTHRPLSDATTAAKPDAGDALLIVDVQNDFLPGGALGVRGGDAVVPVLNAWAAAFAAAGRAVYASRDWHTPDHCSFEAQGGPWPPHCVAGTRGAEFAAGLRLPATHAVISKATHADRDAYSAFEAATADGVGLRDLLERHRVRRLWIGGLATDYCVKASVLDARAAGLEVVVLADAVRAVEVEPGDGERALAAIVAAGATLVHGLPAAGR